jgi:hypothetical protein
MAKLKLKFDGGLNTAADPSEIGANQLVQATGCYYRSGDQRLHKIGGVTTYADTGSGKKIDGIGLLAFDSGGTDKVVALSDGVLYGSNVTSGGTTGTFSSLKSDLVTGAASLSAAHANDRWFLACGTENIVVQSDGTVRDMGMKTPNTFTTVQAASGDNTVYPTSTTGSTYTNIGNAYDADSDTHAYIRSNSGTSTTTFVWSTSDTATGRYLRIRWALGGIAYTNYDTGAGIDDIGTSTDAGFSVNIKMEISEDAGINWTTFLDKRNITQAQAVRDDSYPITDALEISGNLQFRVTVTFNTTASFATFKLYDVVSQEGSTGAAFNTDTGIYYTLTEVDEINQVESAGQSSDLIQFTGGTNNHTKITLPTAVNSNATHFNIYRTTDGGDQRETLTYVGTAAVGAGTWIDNFTRDKDTLGSTYYPWLRILSQQDATGAAPIYIDQNSPPPPMRVIRTFEGSLVGFPTHNKRALVYAMAAKPESFPEINIIEAFPFEEHDELVDGVSLGNIFLISAKGLMMRLTGLPRAVNSIRDNTSIEQIKGAPGCVGIKALTAYSVAGEPRAAWISPYGIYITNGDTIREISVNIDWSVFGSIDKSGWALEWDANRLCLVFSYSTTDGGVNDRYYLLHMAPEHATADDQQPKWTGPHYGSYNCFDTGQVASAHRLYAGHSSNGIVYILDRGTTDASLAYSSTTVPMIAKTAKIYTEDDEWAALDAVLYHTDFGGGQTCTLNWEVGNDHDTGAAGTTQFTISLAGHQGTQLDISQRCQWAQATITHTGTGTGALRDLSVHAMRRGRRGAKRAS